MGTADFVWMALILAAVGYLLYHSLWKKKGHCSGCDACSCTFDQQKGRKLSIKGVRGNEKKSCC